MINIKEYVDFLSKAGLTANQFLLLYLTMLKRYDLIYQYVESIRRNNKEIAESFGGIPQYEIENLKNRGFMDSFGDEKYADNYVVLDKFKKYFKTIDSSEALEFWKLYPDRIYNDTTSWRGKNMNKDEFLIFYNNLINHDKDTHDIIMKTLKYEKTKGLIKEGMQKWLERRPWESFDEQNVNLKNDLI